MKLRREPSWVNQETMRWPNLKTNKNQYHAVFTWTLVSDGSMNKHKFEKFKLIRASISLPAIFEEGCQSLLRVREYIFLKRTRRV